LLIDTVHAGNTITCILSAPGEPEQLSAITVSNHPYSSGYSIVPLHYNPSETANELIDYTVGEYGQLQT
jgi:hypothetical protein